MNSCASVYSSTKGLVVRVMVPALRRNSFLVQCKNLVSPVRDLLTDLLLLLCGRNMLTCGRGPGASD